MTHHPFRPDQEQRYVTYFLVSIRALHAPEKWAFLDPCSDTSLHPTNFVVAALTKLSFPEESLTIFFFSLNGSPLKKEQKSGLCLLFLIFI